jgi:hypothetical protein
MDRRAGRGLDTEALGRGQLRYYKPGFGSTFDDDEDDDF